MKKILFMVSMAVCIPVLAGYENGKLEYSKDDNLWQLHSLNSSPVLVTGAMTAERVSLNGYVEVQNGAVWTLGGSGCI